MNQKEKTPREIIQEVLEICQDFNNKYPPDMAFSYAEKNDVDSVICSLDFFIHKLKRLKK